MGLHGVLAEIHPGWYGDVDPALLQRAQASGIGRRLLARWLAADIAPRLFAPSPQGLANVAARWPRVRLAALARDLGTLAFAPAIRAEVRREPVRRLRHVLGNGYLLALDQSVWDGRVSAAIGKRLKTELGAALGSDAGDHANLLALFDRQGRNEVRAAAVRNDAARDEAALGEWLMLLHPQEAAAEAYLPEKPVTMLFMHHAARAAA